MKRGFKSKVNIKFLILTVAILLSFFYFVHGNSYFRSNFMEKKITLSNKVDAKDDVITVDLDGVSFDMVKVQSGTFKMGSAESDKDERPVHDVSLSSYYICKTEVTQALWTKVMGTTILDLAKEENELTYGVGSDFPMYYVSWNDCQIFISKLNSMTGYNFRLPTEAEWEFAARGGNKSQGFKFSGGNLLDSIAIFKLNSSLKTAPVASMSPNELGLYDMSGNVWEWCQDRYGEKYYSISSFKNPQGPDNGFSRVTRGGSWANDDWYCHPSTRDWDFTDHRDAFIGFRLVATDL